MYAPFPSRLYDNRITVAAAPVLVDLVNALPLLSELMCVGLVVLGFRGCLSRDVSPYSSAVECLPSCVWCVRMMCLCAYACACVQFDP